MNGTKNTFHLPYWVCKMANVVMFYEEKCKKKFENRKIQFLDPLVKIGPPEGQEGSQMTFKDHITCRYTALG